MMYYTDFCFYSPSKNYIYDFIDLDDRTMPDGETLEEVRQQYPDAIKFLSGEALALTGSSYV